MAQNLTASALTAIQARLDSMLPGGGPPSMDMDPNNNRAQTYAGLAENNRANMMPILEPDGTCIGMKVYHIDGDFTPDETDVSSGFATDTCDITAANEPVSVETSYEHNLFAQEFVAIEDGDCANLFVDPSAEGTDRVADLIATRMMRAMVSLREKLNTTATTFLATEATGVNRDASLKDYMTFSAASSQFQVDLQGFFQDPDALTELDLVADLNDLPGYFIHSGPNNFYNAVQDARFRRLNDDQRYLIRWETDLAAPISFDKRLDAALGGKNTFVISPEAYALWNVRLYGTQPTLVQEDEAIWVYSQRDPNLLINDNGVLRPVFYNITYQKTCDGANKVGKRKNIHKFQIQYLGGLAAAPQATDNHTGILRFVDVTGI